MKHIIFSCRFLVMISWVVGNMARMSWQAVVKWGNRYMFFNGFEHKHECTQDGKRKYSMQHIYSYFLLCLLVNICGFLHYRSYAFILKMNFCFLYFFSDWLFSIIFSNQWSQIYVNDIVLFIMLIFYSESSLNFAMSLCYLSVLER